MQDPELTLPGFTPDPDDPNTGYLIDKHGISRRVFLKHSRTPERQATEAAALTLIHQQPVGPPIPHVMAQIEADSGSILALSHEAGVNLADLLSFALQAPPLPPWYRPALLPIRPLVRDLVPLLTEVGQAVRLLHAIRLEELGKLVGLEPNPHRWNARAFTRQEFAHSILLGLEKKVLHPSLAQKIEDWAEQEVSCLSESEPPCLVHFDLHAGNVRVAADPLTGVWHLRALYDFELARGWLPELDLAILQWDLRYLEGDADQAWSGFLEGYGPVDPFRLRLFEGLYLLRAIAYADRYPQWGAWSLPLLVDLVES